MGHEHVYGDWVRYESRGKAARFCPCGARLVVQLDENDQFEGVLEIVPSS